MITERVRDYIFANLAPSVPREQLTADLQLIDRGVLDSIGMFQLMGFLEEQYGIEIDDGELTYDNFHDMTAIADLVQTKQSSRV